ncbi:myotubularin-related protein 13-like isoform X4 [Symsagittifera roscoffensis]|uniref:myotubularin-related protein 13-like isoform X4 n=1 Tax=Symsagittifera roscoffensis TaxID=84072 RepID=UPI00307BD15B
MASNRLVDYFIVIGYDEGSPLDSKNCGQGKIVWMCPPVFNNKPFWNDSYSFPSQLAKMCMPLGWRSSTIYQEPTYFCSQLTSETALDITLACFTMYEPILQLADETLIPRDVQSSRADAFSTVSTASGEDVVYCPKCLIILSTHRYPDTFKQILCQLYNIGMRGGDASSSSGKEKSLSNIETAVANLIGYTDVPSARLDSALSQQFELLRGLPQLSFVVPKDLKIPVTGKSVLEFFNCIGTFNALAIVIGVLAGAKVILSSVSLTKLTESIHAVISLLYPLQVEHEGSDGRPISLMSTTRVPVLPHEILRYVNSPFPYIYGVHSSLMEELRSQCDSDLSDILIADLDNSAVQLPKNDNELCLPERVQTQVLSQLQSILDPNLQDRDKAFTTSLTEKSNSTSDLMSSNRKPESIQLGRPNNLFMSSGGALSGPGSPSSSQTGVGNSHHSKEAPRELQMDKQIRAVFMQLLAHIMHKYRQCLVVVRVHPNPVLKLDKFSFMKARPDLEKVFLEMFLNDNMLFKNFIEARGSPFRSVDLMDHMIDSENLETFCNSKNFTKNTFYESIEDLARFLLQNETPSTAPSSVSVNPTRRWDVNYVFPTDLNTQATTSAIKEGIEKRKSMSFNGSKKSKMSTSLSSNELCIVPGTTPGDVTRSVFDLDTLGNWATVNTVQLPAVKKRLDGLEKCIKSIFEGRISDVYSGLDASLKILNSTLSAKRLLVHRLREHVIDTQNDSMRPVELNVRLLHFLSQLVNEALVFEDGTEVDHDIVRGVLSIASCYYSRLSMQNFSQMQQHMAKTQTSTFAGGITELECPPPTRLPHQFLCTLIQGHPVWHSHQFWIHAFYLDVEKQLHKMYTRFGSHGEKLPDERSTIQRVADQLKEKQKWAMQQSSMTNGLSGTESANVSSDADSGLNEEEPPVETKESFEQKTKLLAKSEQQNAFSQALDYLTQIVQLQMPLRTPVYRSRMSSKTYSSKSGGGESGSTGRDEDDREMGGNESSPGEIEKFLSRFVQDAMESTECSKEYTEKAFAELHNIMEQQAQTLSEIYTAAKEGDDSAFYPQKYRPVLLPKEDYIPTATELGGEEGLPIRLLADVKTLTNPLNGDLPYLPANGNIYLTNYRIIVIAHPRHVLTCDQLIHKSFPISMLLKMEKVEEKIRADSTAATLKEVTFHRKVWQFVFSNFQVLRVVFDADIAPHMSDKRAEAFVDSVKELRRCSDNYVYSFMPPYLFISSGGCNGGSGRESGYYEGRDLLPNKPKSKTANTIRSSTLRLLSVPKTLRTFGGGISASYHQQKKTLGLTLASTNELDDDFDNDGFTMRSSNNGGFHSTQTLERLEKTRLVQDYLRLHLGSSLADNNSTHTWTKTVKLGGSSSSHSGAGGSEKRHGGVGGSDFKISAVNSKYDCCETYPASLVIPAAVNDSILGAVKMFYRTHRLPVVTWRDRKGNGSLLIRASCLINSRNVFTQPFKKTHNPQPVQSAHEGYPVGGGGGGGGAGATKEFREYIRALLDVIPKPSGWIECGLASPNPVKRSSRSSRNLIELHRTSSEFMGGHGSYSSSPKKHGSKMSKLANRVTHNLGTLTQGFGGGKLGSSPKTLSVPKRLFMVGTSNNNSSSSVQKSKRGGPFKSKFGGNHHLIDPVYGDTNSYEGGQQQTSSGYDNELSPGSETSSICSQTSLPFSFGTKNTACLFIFVGDVKDKKNPFLAIGAAAEIVPVEVLSSSKLRDSFTNLLNSLAPPDNPKRSKYGGGGADPPVDMGISHEKSGTGGGKSPKEHVDKWLQQVSKLLHVTMQVVTVMAQGKSVMLCLEDHNDMTAQVTSLAQLLMDPEYRTVDGFCTLVDKEWLSFGHRFKYKTGQFDFPSNGFCPTFLLFLDAVNQALVQHPTEFEFNSFFLQTIAYHHMSNRFSTFLGNSDLDRIKLQAALFENDATAVQEGRESLWRFLNTMHNASPHFINYSCSTYKDFTGLFEDSPKHIRFVSNPGCLYLNWSVAALELWSFYLPESLTDANLYELDLEPNPHQPEQKNFMTGSLVDPQLGTPENQQSLINASVSAVNLQDEVSLFLKRAIDNGIIDPNQTINHYYRSRCPQKKLQFNGSPNLAKLVSVDNLLKDLAYKSLAILVNQRHSLSSASANQNASSGNNQSASHLTHQFTSPIQSNSEHCELCKQRISTTALTGVACVICEVMLHKSCQSQWSRPCRRKKESINATTSAMVKSPSFSYSNQKSSSSAAPAVEILITSALNGAIDTGMGSSDSNSAAARDEGTLTASNEQSQSSNAMRSSSEGGGRSGKNDTMSKYHNKRVLSEKVTMYKQTRHLRQWKKQLVEYFPGRNVLRFAEPHSDGSFGGVGKYKEIPMNSILDVSIQLPKKFDIVLPNHFDGYAMIRMQLTNREYFLLVQHSKDAEKWADLLSNRIAD